MEKPFRGTAEPTPPDELDDIVLRQQLDQAEREGQRASGRLNRLDENLERIEAADDQRVKSIHESAEVVGRRVVTDPNSDELGARPRESISANLTVVPLIGRIARKYSVHVEGNETGPPDENPEFDVAAAGLLGRIRDSLSGRRLARQKDRQARSDFTEKSYGTNVGLGKEAFFGTRINRINNWLTIRRRYMNGEITAAERRDMVRDRSTHTRADRQVALEAHREGHLERGEMLGVTRSGDVVHTTTGAVRREVRRERAGALYTQARAEQPVAKQVRKARKSVAEKRIERAEDRQAAIDERIAQLRAEQHRRAEATLDERIAELEAERRRLEEDTTDES